MKALEIFGHRTTDMNIIVRPYGSEFCHCRPDTTWERENRDFYSPECVNEIWWTPVVFARVCKAGKCVGNKFVGRYYDGLGCGMLMYGAVGQPEASIGPLPLYEWATPPTRGWENANSGHQAAPTETRQALVSCIDRSSILPMPLYEPCVMDGCEGFSVRIGDGKSVEGNGQCEISLCHVLPTGQGEWKELLEETICRASELTSLRIGDFVAVELEVMKRLASKEAGTTSVKGTFCENEIFDFNVIF